MKATTQLTLRHSAHKDPVVCKATGNPLRIQIANPGGATGSLADVDELVAAGWLPLGDLTAFRKAVIRGEKHHG